MTTFKISVTAIPRKRSKIKPGSLQAFLECNTESSYLIRAMHVAMHERRHEETKKGNPMGSCKDRNWARHAPVARLTETYGRPSDAGNTGYVDMRKHVYSVGR